MFHFDLSLYNPWSKRFEILSSKSMMISTNKACESNIYSTNSIIKFSIDITTRRDHSGATMSIGAFGFEYELNFYDTRHWCHKTGTWEQQG